MAKEKKGRNSDKRKNISETVQELYFYPDCSKQECTIRICAWMISWVFGVVIPETINGQALGGCYFVLSISLLVDFLCKKRTQLVAIVIYGLFCALLIITALGAIILIAKTPPAEGATSLTESTTLEVESTTTTESTTLVAENTTSEKLYIFASKNLPRIGVGLFIIMFINLLCVLIEVHKIIYTEKDETEHEREIVQKVNKTEQETTRYEFMNNLEPSKEGGKQ